MQSDFPLINPLMWQAYTLWQKEQLSTKQQQQNTTTFNNNNTTKENVLRLPKHYSRTEDLLSGTLLRIKWNTHGWYNVRIETVIRQNANSIRCIVRGTENGKEFLSDAITLYASIKRQPYWVSPSQLKFPKGFL
tara:strand:- start:208 stop:609 length:402 start_codon:yes stop_codon:yes gene_type:complete